MSDPLRSLFGARGRGLVLGLSCALALGAALLAPGCLERRDDDPTLADQQRCARCHGDADRPGDALTRAAPPRDLLGNDDASYPGVGAHQIHLQASDTHAAVACSECHVVPDETNAPGHVDDDLPADLTFGTIASTGGRTPSYDSTRRRCSDTWCHRDAQALWTKPRSSADACGTCHTLPPAAPHPQGSQCSACHSKVVDASGNIIAPELHVNGTIDVDGEGCNGCHGSENNPAPPKDTTGSSDPTAIGVGAHQAHLAGGAFSRAVECKDCHVVPEKPDDPGHGDALPAELNFAGVAVASGRKPTWDRTAMTCSQVWCHGPTAASQQPTPNWTTGASLTCTGCHGAPPAPPHPQMTDCSFCHGDVVADDDVTMKDRTLHVNGVVDVQVDTQCTACHGSTNPAPPKDLQGNTATTSPGVGAHQAHVVGSGLGRAVPCGECHKVPSQWLDPGHVDTSGGAELNFSGVAVFNGTAPTYANEVCTNTYCHGALFANSKGTLTTPKWTLVDGTQKNCGTCHGLPPGPPHLPQSQAPVCSACHPNISSDNFTFINPEQHIDGIVQKIP
ncbi:MAG: CxxxxCH/CxxCH domain-containing protein [Polyangiaceae bacterium]